MVRVAEDCNVPGNRQQIAIAYHLALCKMTLIVCNLAAVSWTWLSQSELVQSQPDKKDETSSNICVIMTWPMPSDP